MFHRFSRLGAQRHQKPGFTLVELLVVIAIITLLAAILFPVFGRVRENARRSNCLSNQRQIGLGIMQYVQDNDERYPQCRIDPPSPPGPGETVWTTKGNWQEAIYPYVKSLNVFMCPSNPANKTMVLEGKIPVSYALTYSSYGGPIGDYSVKSRLLSEVAAPSTTFLLGEGSDFYPDIQVDKLFVSHLQKMNVAFADGHSKTMTVTGTCDPPYTWNYTGAVCAAAVISKLQTSQNNAK